MEVKQIYEAMNAISAEVLGKTDLIGEDLSGIVDMGTEVFNQNAVDAYVRSLVNHIGKVVFVNRPYAGKVPSVLMDAWEFGSVLEKISAETPVATENLSWELEDGEAYPQDVFYQPKVTAKFFNSKVTFEVPISITEKQVKQSFSNAEQLNAFISMIYSAVEKSLTIKTDALVMRTINNMVAETFKADAETFIEAGGLTKASTVRCVNLAKLYKDQFGTEDVPAEKLMNDPEFIRFASYTMGVYMDRMQSISSLFNIGGKDRFTPADMMHVVLLSDFARAADTYLASDTFHNEYVKLPKHETVPYWQGSGTAYDFKSVSTIAVKKEDNENDFGVFTGVLGVMFDRDALGVANLEKRVTTNYNAKAEFFNNYFKFDAGYFNDTNENFVVFYIGPDEYVPQPLKTGLDD